MILESKEKINSKAAENDSNPDLRKLSPNHIYNLSDQRHLSKFSNTDNMENSKNISNMKEGDSIEELFQHQIYRNIIQTMEEDSINKTDDAAINLTISNTLSCINSSSQLEESQDKQKKKMMESFQDESELSNSSEPEKQSDLFLLEGNQVNKKTPKRIKKSAKHIRKDSAQNSNEILSNAIDNKFVIFHSLKDMKKMTKHNENLSQMLDDTSSMNFQDKENNSNKVKKADKAKKTNKPNYQKSNSEESNLSGKMSGLKIGNSKEFKSRDNIKNENNNRSLPKEKKKSNRLEDSIEKADLARKLKELQDENNMLKQMNSERSRVYYDASKSPDYNDIYNNSNINNFSKEENDMKSNEKKVKHSFTDYYTYNKPFEGESTEQEESRQQYSKYDQYGYNFHPYPNEYYPNYNNYGNPNTNPPMKQMNYENPLNQYNPYSNQTQIFNNYYNQSYQCYPQMNFPNQDYMNQMMNPMFRMNEYSMPQPNINCKNVYASQFIIHNNSGDTPKPSKIQFNLQNMPFADPKEFPYLYNQLPKGAFVFGIENSKREKKHNNQKSPNSLYSKSASTDLEPVQLEDTSEGSSLEVRVFFSKLNLLEQDHEVDKIVFKNIVVIAKDQNQCRLLQKTIEEKIAKKQINMDILFRYLQVQFVEVSNEQFGNYFIQKMIEFMSKEMIDQVIALIGERFTLMALSPHGTRVIQKIIDCLTTEEQIDKFTSYLKKNILVYMKDPNSLHIITQFLTKFKGQESDFIIDSLCRNYLEITTDKFGCCLYQKCLQEFHPRRSDLVKVILGDTLKLLEDAYGNYVIQHLIKQNDQSCSDYILKILCENIRYLSKKKFSSNVIEKLISSSNNMKNPIMRDALIQEIFRQNIVVELLFDPNGNYIIQKMLKVVNKSCYDQLIHIIGSHLDSLVNLQFGIKLIKKLTSEFKELNGYIKDPFIMNKLNGHMHKKN